MSRHPARRPSYYGDRRTSAFRFEVPVSTTSVADKRTAYTFDALQATYPFIIPSQAPLPPTTSSPKCTCDNLATWFPIIDSLRTYERSYFKTDMVAGLLVGFLHVPQSLAYSFLADLPVISGIFTSIIPVFVYTFFGTSVHLSMGTNSIVSLITADMVDRELYATFDKLEANHTYTAEEEQAREKFKLGLAMASTAISGILFLAMGTFRLGFLTCYLPSSFVGGFTMAAGVHIGTSQVPKALNIKMTNPSGWCKVGKVYKFVYDNVEKINLIDLGIAGATLVVVLLFSDVINPRLKRSFLKLDIPINLVVVIIGTVLSFVLSLHADHDVAIIGEMPDGVPTPVLPDLSLVRNIITDCVMMVMVTFTLNISMALVIGRIHHQEVKPNNELIAYGMCNLLSSPFQCHVSSVSPARCMMLHNDDVKSVFHSVPTILLLLSVIMGLGRALKHLPIAVLAAIVWCAIRGLITQGRQLPRLWRVCRSDFVVWVSTFLVTTFVDIGVGLIFGISTAFVMVVVENQRVQGNLLVKSKWENVFMRGDNRRGVNHLPNIRIFHFPAQLCYFNAEILKRQLFKKVLDPTKIKDLTYDVDDSEDDLVMVESQTNIHSVRCIILDCSAMTRIDTDGVNMLKILVILYHKAGIQILLVRCTETVYATLERADFFTVLPSTCVFYDLVDALKYEQYTRQGVTLLTALSSARGSLGLGANFSYIVKAPPQSNLSSTDLDIDTSI